MNPIPLRRLLLLAVILVALPAAGLPTAAPSLTSPPSAVVSFPVVSSSSAQLSAATLPSTQDRDADRLEVGADMPDLELEDLDGETHRTTSLAGEAALVVIFFRGAW